MTPSWVAEGQQMMQTLPDPFLGYTRFGLQALLPSTRLVVSFL
jgi:hypothetical protein